MSAFDNLKLAMIPTAWKDGKLYSAIPEETFGNNSITNGGFDDATNWILSTGWTIENGTANYNGTTSTTHIRQNNALQPLANTTYKITFDIIAQIDVNIGFASSGSFMKDPDGNNLRQTFTSGTYTVYGKTANSATDFRIYGYTNAGSGSIDNISVQQVLSGDFNFSRGTSGTRIYSSGLLQTITDVDAPRLDYTGGGCPSVLLEPQRENLITYSEDLTQTGWTTNAVSRTNDSTVTNPTGGLGATKISGNNAGSYHNVKFNFPATGSTVTHSVFVKADNLFHFEFIETYGGSPYAIAQYDLQNVTATIPSGTLFSNARIETFSNGWYRCSVVASAYNQLHFNISDGSTTTGITYVQSDESIYMWGAQTEAGSYPTSYIPTSGTTVTRSQDFAGDAGNADIFNQTEGVLYGEIEKKIQFTGQFALISINNAAANNDQNSVTIGWHNGNNFYLRVKSPSGTFTYQTMVANANQFYKVAIKYKSGDIACWVDGVEVATSTQTFSFATTLDNLSFDYNGNNTLPFLGEIKGLYYFDRALTDEELTSLTT